MLIYMPLFTHTFILGKKYHNFAQLLFWEDKFRQLSGIFIHDLTR